jgi:hypothetical protein
MNEMTAAVVSLAIDKAIIAGASFACGWLWRATRDAMAKKDGAE